MRPLISVIVPVYKTEKFLDRCVQSIVNQTYKNLQIILIDDESPDSCPRLCDEWSKKDTRVIVLHQKNAGVSNARNTGIQYSRGEYITFVDSDDYLENEIIEKAFNEITKSNSQLCQWGYSLIKDNKSIPGPELFYRNSSKEDIYSAVISIQQKSGFELGSYFRAVWGKLFDSKIIKENNIVFDKKLYIGEDAVFLLQYMKFIKKMCVVNFHGYNYRQINSSAVHRYKPDLLKQNIEQLKSIQEFLDCNNLSESRSICISMASFSWEIFNNLIRNSNLEHSKTNKKDVVKWYKAVHIWRRSKYVEKSHLRKAIRAQYIINKYFNSIYINIIFAKIYNKLKYKNV